MKPKSLIAALMGAAALFAGGAALACPTHIVPLPDTAGDGPAKEHQVVLDTPFVKLVTITLRKGTALPEHAAPVPVTIQALSGNGTVITDGKPEKISPTSMILVAPGAKHEVKPEGQGDLVLLVHYLKMKGGGDAAAHGHDGADSKAHGHGEHDGHAH